MPPEPSPGPAAPTPTSDTKYTLTVDQTAGRFVAAGFPRSPRSIQRYCQLGHLRAVSVPTESGRIYLIDEKSVEERIEELRQVAPFSRPQGDDSRRVETRHDAPHRDETRHSATSRVELEEALKRIKDLETETRTLEIDKRVRDAMLEQMQKDRERLLNDLQHFVETMNDQSRQIGRLEALLALPEAKGDNSRAREPEATVQ
jgi:hypothetical protein